MKRIYREHRPFMILLFIVAVIVPLGFIVMALWNNILATVLHVSMINFWQALGILLLSKILFGGFPGGWGRHHYRNSEWRKQMHEKWQTMSPEERAQFQEQWKARCGRWKTDVPETKTSAGAE